ATPSTPTCSPSTFPMTTAPGPPRIRIIVPSASATKTRVPRDMGNLRTVGEVPSMLTHLSRKAPDFGRGAPGHRGAYSRSVRRGGTLAVVIALTVGMLAVPASSAGATTVGQKGAKSGGEVVWGLDAETPEGWCLPASQLAASGIIVANAIYDTLVTINSKGDYVPYLAESVTPNATYDQWTIKLRPGVRFHDGSALDADVVKL